MKMTCLHCGEMFEIMDNEDLEFHTGLSCAVSKDPSCNLPECVLRRNEEIAKLNRKLMKMKKSIRKNLDWYYIDNDDWMNKDRHKNLEICKHCYRVKSDTCCAGPNGRRVVSDENHKT